MNSNLLKINKIGFQRNQLRLRGIYNETPPDDKTPKVFTEDELNKAIEKALAKERDVAKKANETLVSELTKLKENTKLTDEERTGLEKRIEELNNVNLTEKQQFENKLKKTQTEHEALLKSLTGERDNWQSLYQKEKTVNEIMMETKKAGGARHQQFLDILMPKSKIAPVLDDSGKPTGEWKVVIPWTIKDKKGSVTADHSVEAVIASMKDNVEEYGNLFEANLNGGTGFRPTGKTEKTLTNADLAKLSPADYAKAIKGQ